MEPFYPMSLDDQRSYPEGYNGTVFVWDIDKTYLDTHFSSFQGLARIPLEFAIDKRSIPGMAAILRGLRRGAGEEFACAPLYFVSASPPQLRPVIERKMLLDGVEYDGLIFKDWIKTLCQFRPRRLREHIGFKLCALLAARASRPLSQEYLFGDDVETDALAFSLYADMINGVISAGDAETRMADAGVSREDRASVRAYLDRLDSSRGPVQQIFIHLAHKTPPYRFRSLHPLLVPVRGACQLALALYQLGHIPPENVRQAVTEVAATRPVEGCIADALEGQLISPEQLAQLQLAYVV